MKKWKSRASLLFSVVSLNPIFLQASGVEASGCSQTLLMIQQSPDHKWQAAVHEDVCADGAFTTVVSDSVQIFKNGSSPSEKGIVFTLDEGGDADFRPVIKWLSANKLEIKVRPRALIGDVKKAFEGVSIVVREETDE